MKKAYIIPLVILLLFVSVFPSFAVVNDTSAYLFQSSKLIFSYPTRPAYTWGYYNLTTVCTATNNGFDLTIPSGGSGVDLYPSLKSRHYYLYTFSVNTLHSDSGTLFFRTTTSVISQLSITRDPLFLHFYGFVDSTAENSLYPGFQSNRSIKLSNLIVFDLTLMGYDETNYQNAYDDLVNFGFDFNSYLDFGDHYIYKPESISQPFFNFYSGLFHSFDYFPQLLNEYSGIFILVSAVLSILILTFFVVFMIKRFTGGKT